MVAGGAEDEYEETSLHPPAALSLPGDELLRAPSAASIVILPVSFAVPQVCHQSTVQPPLSSSQSAQTLPLATNIYQVQQIFANFSSSRIFFFKHHLFNPVRGCPEFFQKLILSEVKLRDKNRDHGGQDDHDYHDNERIMIL